ncbi:MAG: anti-sigma factor family protein [Planctomycetota bacterium]|jgi:hypothetical protein
MNCTEAREIIPLAVSGDAPHDGEGLEEHLATCPVCRREWEVFTGLRDYLGEAVPSPAPMGDAEFLTGVSRKAGQHRLARPGGPGVLGLAIRLSAAAAVVACMVVAVALTVGDSAPVKPGRTGETALPSIETEKSPGVEVLVPLEGTEVFGLHHAGPPEEVGDLLREIEVVPNPRSSEGSEKGDFPLQEMLPVTDVEVCADF